MSSAPPLHVPELAFVGTDDLVNELYARSSAMLLMFTPKNSTSGNHLKVKVRGNSYTLGGFAAFATELARTHFNTMILAPLNTPFSFVELIPKLEGSEEGKTHDVGDEDPGAWDDPYDDGEDDDSEDNPNLEN